MTMLSAGARARLPRILAATLLATGLAATCAASSPGSSAASTRGVGSASSLAKSAAAKSATAKTATGNAAAAAQSTALVRAGVVQRLGVQSAAAAPSGYAPADLRSAYNLTAASAVGGKGATVAIIGIGGDPTAAADLAVYRAQYGLPACTTASGCLATVNAAGQPSPLPPPAPSNYLPWPQVAAMDMSMDMVSAVCPNCRILLVERAYPFDGLDLGPAVDTAVGLDAKYVMIAGVGATSASPAYSAEYFDHPGVAITVPAGDHGYQQPGSGANFPVTSPFVTSVGGTTLTRAQNARGWSETVWQPSRAEVYEGTSSQCALVFPKPSWQTDAGCAGRTDNDVAADADPATGIAFYDTTDADGWNVGGGTTVAASIVAATYALAGPPAADSYPASYPYLNGAGLYPVTSGSNVVPPGDTCTPAYLCTAGPGYNGPAGLGTPDGTAAFAVPAATTVTLIGPGAQTAAELPETVSVPMSAGDSADNPLTFTATGLPAGLTINPSTGLISGTIDTYYKGTVSVTATDATGPTASVSFGWLAEDVLHLYTPAIEQTEPGSAVTLTLKATDTNANAPVSYGATGLPPGLSIDAATGVISGTTTATAGSYNVTLTASDPTGSSVSVLVTWRVWNTITVSVASEKTIPAGAAVSIPVSATDSASGQTLTFSATGLPPGFSINPTSGEITGSSATPAEGTITVTATDGSGSQGTAYTVWSVLGTATIVSPGNLGSIAGHGVQLPLTVTDTANPVMLNYSITGAPPGIYVSWTPYTPTGWQSPTLAGWPAPPGTYKTTITANGTGTESASVSFTWTVVAAPDFGPTGSVRLNLDGKCLDDTGNSSANGNKIQIWSCNRDAAQNWTYAEDGTLRIHGKCLDATGYGTTAGTKLQLYTCLGHANQLWTPTGTDELASAASGLCLSDPGASGVNGTQVELGNCLAGARAQWARPPGQILSGVRNECVTEAGGGSADGTKIVLGACSDSIDQRWTFDADGTIRIFGKCLALASPAVGSGAVLEPCTGSYRQQWYDSGSNTLDGLIGADGSWLEAPDGASGTQLVLGQTGQLGSSWYLW